MTRGFRENLVSGLNFSFLGFTFSMFTAICTLTLLIASVPTPASATDVMAPSATTAPFEPGVAEPVNISGKRPVPPTSPVIPPSEPSPEKTILPPNPEGEKPLVQLAILLDVSGSMDGLINQARTKLWKIVNQFALATRNGQRPRIEVALFEYGKSSLPSSEGFQRMICPLTTDLDLVSEELFKLATNGGDEYCGWVIRSSCRTLAWSKSENDYKAIFIAGNEPFSQGDVDFKESCRDAIAKGIIVNTVYCGSESSLEAGDWKKGAEMADGQFASIDHNVQEVAIAAPQDVDIQRLNNELNTTYIAFGAEGLKKKERQVAQDRMAMAAAPSAMAGRVAAKASVAYSAASWDLVDAQKEGGLDLGSLGESEMPAEMRELKSDEEREEYVKGLSEKRAKIQEEIKKLAEEREKFVAAKKKEMSLSEGDGFDAAVIGTVVNQASKKGFVFEKK